MAIVILLCLSAFFAGCVHYCHYTTAYPSFEQRITLPRGLLTHNMIIWGPQWGESGYAKCCKTGDANLSLDLFYYDTASFLNPNVLLKVDSVMLQFGGQISMVQIDKDDPALQTKSYGLAARYISITGIKVPCGYKEEFFLEFNLQVIDETNMSVIYDDRVTVKCKLKKGWYSPLWPGR